MPKNTRTFWTSKIKFSRFKISKNQSKKYSEVGTLVRYSYQTFNKRKTLKMGPFGHLGYSLDRRQKIEKKRIT